MKKLLLLLFAILLFAPPGRAQNTKTVTILSSDGVEFDVNFDAYSTAGIAAGAIKSLHMTSQGANSGSSVTFPLHGVSKISCTDLNIDFDYTEIVAPSVIPSGKTFNRTIKRGAMYVNGSVNLFPRAKFTISTTSSNYLVKEVRFYGSMPATLATNGSSPAATSAYYKAYTRNLKGSNGEELNLPETTPPANL